MSDVSCFIGIDAGMLDQNFALRHVVVLPLIDDERASECCAVYVSVDIPRAGNFKALESWDRSDASDNFFGDLARSFAQLLGKLKCKRHRVLAQLDFGRLLDHDFRQLQAILAM